MRPDRLLARIRSGSLNDVAFRDFVLLVRAAGFVHQRTRGSHLIFRNDRIGQSLNVQPDGSMAKPYQIKEFLRYLEEYPEILEERTR